MKVFSPFVGEEEQRAAAEVLESQWLGVGPKCNEMEMRLAELWRVRQSHVILTNSCTSATHLALRSMGIARGDEVIIPTIHFPAAANAVMQLGARVVLCDVHPHSMMPRPHDVQRVLSDRTRAVFLLHYGGRVCGVDAIRTILPPQVMILEDAAVATVSTHNGKAAGTMGDAGVWSFDAMKILTMGDGGALWLKDERHADYARVLTNLGMNSASGSEKARTADSRWWEFNVLAPSGYYASNDVAASIGLAQLRKLHRMIGIRRELYEAYDDMLASEDLPIVLPPMPSPCDTSSYYTYWIKTERRDELARYLLDRGIYTTFRYYPLHKVYDLGGHYPGAESAAARTLNLPLHPHMTIEHVIIVVKEIASFFNR